RDDVRQVEPVSLVPGIARVRLCSVRSRRRYNPAPPVRRGGSGGGAFRAPHQPRRIATDFTARQSPLHVPHFLIKSHEMDLHSALSVARNKLATCPFDPPPARQATRPASDGRGTRRDRESPSH